MKPRSFPMTAAGTRFEAEIAPYARGVERVETTADGEGVFIRLPDGLADDYRVTDASRVRLECTSGVCLRVRTDATGFRIGLAYGAAARPFYQGVVAAGNAVVGFGPASAADAWEGEVVAPGTGMRVVEIWLPHLVQTRLRFIEWLGPTRVEPAARAPTRWMAMGDSITQGMTAPLPTDTWVTRCARELDLDVRNLGIGGATLAGFLAERRIAWPYDLMTIAFGTNDFNGRMPPDDHARNLRRFLDARIRERPTARFVVLTPPPWINAKEPNSFGSRLSDYRRASEAICRGLPGVTVVHGDDLMRAEPELFVDGVHPNANGMAEFAASLIPRLRSILKRRASINGSGSPCQRAGAF